MQSGPKVLVAEDERALAIALKLKLSNVGCDVTTAANGQEALSYISRQQFDVMLLDLIMPVVDGYEVLEKIKYMKNRPIIFVLSNLSQSEDKQHVLAMGAEKFLVKSDTALSAIANEVLLVSDKAKTSSAR